MGNALWAYVTGGNFRLFSQATDSPLAQSLWGSNQSLVITVFAGERLNIKMPSYQYRDYHEKDKTVSRPSYFYN